MSSFYTYCQSLGNKILLRGYEDGEPILKRIDYSPTLFIKTKEKTSYKSFFGDSYLEPITFTNMREARDFKEQYKDVSNFSIHGQDKWHYQFINQNYKGEIEYTTSDVRMLILDIEVVDEEKDGFPDIASAATPIVLISLFNSKNGKTTVLGLKDYTPLPDDDFDYKLFSNEREMLKYFIAYNAAHGFDVWTGWNTTHFDIPYIVNRIMRLFGDEMVKKLSPFNYYRAKTIEVHGKEVTTYDIYGIVDLDYLELYKKFGTYSAKESYALDFIAYEELGENKLELPGNSFRDSYVNYFDIFVRYNAKDTLLVQKLDAKKKLIDVAFSLAYLYKCNLQDIYKTVVPWEVFIYNRLEEKGIVMPPRKNSLDADFDGAWVKEPKPGMYGWMMSFDFASLYPSIIRQWNISPETFDNQDIITTVNDWLRNTEKAQYAQTVAKDSGLSVAANGTMYRKDFQGILAELMEYLMVERKKTKDEMLRLEEEYQRTGNEDLQAIIDALDNRQMAFKIAANSAYGAIGNKGFLYYDYRMAEAITLTGQLSDIHLANALNDKMNNILETNDVDYIALADTDSVYLDCATLVERFCAEKSHAQIVFFLDTFGAKVCQKVINASVDYIFEISNAFDKVMKSKREAIASKTLIRAKKNYAMYVHNSEGVTYDPPKLKIMGIEVVRSSTPAWCRNTLKECVRDMFEHDEDYLQEKFSTMFESFKQLPPENIAFPRGISDIDKWTLPQGRYKSKCPIHVRGSIVYNHFTEQFKKYPPINNGDKVKFIYLKMPNPVRQNVIAFPTSGTLPPELGLEKYIDYKTQFSKAFREPLESLTSCADWDLEEKSTLEAFFV